MPDPTAQPSLSPEPPHPAWLLTPADIRAVLADDALRDRLAASERPDEHDLDPVAAGLAAWLAEVANDAVTTTAVTS
jgi:hypothetical protein